MTSIYFQGNIFLRTVDLSYNGFGRDGAAALGQALKDNSVLEELNVRCEVFLRVSEECWEELGIVGAEIQRSRVCVLTENKAG